MGIRSGVDRALHTYVRKRSDLFFTGFRKANYLMDYYSVGHSFGKQFLIHAAAIRTEK